MSDEFKTVVPYEQSFDHLYGLELLETDNEDGSIKAQVPVSDRVRQPLGLVHGGIFCSIAETLASIGTYFTVRDENKIAVGQSNNASFLRPITEGTIHATAHPRHRGRTTWVWDVEITDDDGMVCALARVTIAVRDR